jgi:hypothetical protein
VRRWFVGALACSAAVLFAAHVGASGVRRAPFPLAAGNHWTLRAVDSGVPLRITVRRSGKSFVLQGFPGTTTLRVRPWRGGVQAWDRADRRWEPFLRLGARAGTTYAVDLAGTSEWRNLRVEIASRHATTTDYRGTSRRDCILVALHPNVPVADAGIEALAFAPGIGPVRVVEQSFIGPRVRLLDSFRARS